MAPIGRRLLIASAAAIAASPAWSRASFATMPGRSPKRLVLIVMRGAMDGLAAVPPVGDVDYASAHGALAIPAPGMDDGALVLDGRFGLHPAMVAIHPLYASGEMLVFHAMASPGHSRSHFDAQNMLENGTDRTTGVVDGWLNRALGCLGAERWSALAVGPMVPLVLRGASPVGNWKPETELSATPGLVLSVATMYASDPALSSALSRGLKTSDMIDAAVDGGLGTNGRRRVGGGFRAMAGAAGHILAADGGPNIAVMDIGGWDTHVGQGAGKGRLAGALGEFATGVAALRDGLGARWKDTAVVAVTEFGRTVGPNGTGGTDHGTGTAGFLMGGAVAGGRVLSEWPGLSQKALYQARDLASTTDIRSMLKAVLGDHLGCTSGDLEAKVFPGSLACRPLPGLFKA
jgi:uncharacterized protein (DUF1501 family)